MPEISLFVDEPGESGTESKYYLLTLVFHEQNSSIDKQIELYENALHDKGLPDIPLHTSPLLNGHDDYEGMDVQDRKRLLQAFFTCFNAQSSLAVEYDRSSGHESTDTKPQALSGNSLMNAWDTYPPMDCPTRIGLSNPSRERICSSINARSSKLQSSENGRDSPWEGGSHTKHLARWAKQSTCLSNKRWSAVRPGKKTSCAVSSSFSDTQ